MKKNLLDALNEDRPEIVAKTDNMFITSEYARATGVATENARRRLLRLMDAGKVRRVVFKDDSKLGRRIYQGWEYIGAGR